VEEREVKGVNRPRYIEDIREPIAPDI